MGNYPASSQSSSATAIYDKRSYKSNTASNASPYPPGTSNVSNVPHSVNTSGGPNSGGPNSGGPNSGGFWGGPAGNVVASPNVYAPAHLRAASAPLAGGTAAAPGAPVCKLFLENACSVGEHCKFAHV